MKWNNHLSIRTKLLIWFSGMFFLMIMALILLNQFFVDDFFIYKNQQVIDRITEQALRNSEVTDYGKLQNVITKGTGCDVMFTDSEFNNLTNNSRSISNSLINKNELSLMMSYATGHKSEGSFKVIGTEDYNSKRIVYVRELEPRKYLVLSKGLGVVMESRQLFIMFLFFASLFVYLMSFILICFFSVRFTKPIIELQKGAQRMANFDFSKSVITSSNDEVGKLIGSVNKMAFELSTNIQALKKSNELLEKELSKEKSLEKMRRRFVLDVSHELKNPISVLIGYGEGLLKGIPKTNEDQKYYAQVIVEEGIRMNQIVKDLLDLSSYTSGVLTIHKENVNFSNLVTDTVGRFSEVKTKKNVHVQLNLTENVNIQGDPLRLSQVLINLLDNAFKNVENNGKIIISLVKENEFIELKISNTGNLIPVNELDNIWESFYQVDTDRDGHGLGLAILKSIVEFHSGTVSVKVDENMNHFSVILP